MYHTLNCRMSDLDYLTAEVDSDGDVRIELRAGDSNHIYARPEDFAEFARQILADAGEDPRNGVVKVGDYVEVTKYRNCDSRYVGKRGRVTTVDNDDIPYRVEFDDGVAAWTMEVRKVSAPPAGPASLVDQAKTLLAGTSPTAADIVAMVRILVDTK